MSTTQKLLRFIIAYPGSDARTLADEFDIEAKAVSTYLRGSIEKELVSVAKRSAQGGPMVNVFMPTQKLIDGGEALIANQGRRGPWKKADSQESEGSDSTIACGFTSDGALSLTKGKKHIQLTCAETKHFLNFIDAINIERILGEAE